MLDLGNGIMYIFYPSLPHIKIVGVNSLVPEVHIIAGVMYYVHERHKIDKKCRVIRSIQFVHSDKPC